MKWTEEQTDTLKHLCNQGLSNKAIAAHLDCSLNDVYAKRSQLGITIAKCKGIEPNPKFEKAIEPIKPKGMTKDVRYAFKKLLDQLLLTMASNWTSVEDAREYHDLSNELIDLEEKYNARIGR